MSGLRVIKKIFLNHLVPCTIFIGALSLFLILSQVLFSIKRFYLFMLFIFLIMCLISSVFTMKHKIAQAIHMLFFAFFIIILGLITKLTITHNNPWALFYKIQTISNTAQTLYFQEKDIKNFPPKTELFSTYLELELKSLLNQKTPINENIFGVNITFHSYQDLALLFQEIFINKDYYIALNTDTPTIIDCGSNEGLSILFFKMVYPNSKIIGFEAHPKNFQNLQANIKNNKLSNITLINKAVYNSEGTVTFSLANSPGSQILKTQEKDCITVNSTLLSTHITEPVDLLKMDIEGAESPVIEELARHKKLTLIKNIIMEFHYYADKNYNNFVKTLHTLEENGFLYQINKTDPHFRCSIIHAYQK